MTPQNWDKIKEIFLEAIEIDSPDERAEFLTESCDGDEELKREVEKINRPGRRIRKSDESSGDGRKRSV